MMNQLEAKPTFCVTQCLEKQVNVIKQTIFITTAQRNSQNRSKSFIKTKIQITKSFISSKMKLNYLKNNSICGTKM